MYRAAPKWRLPDGPRRAVLRVLADPDRAPPRPALAEAGAPAARGPGPGPARLRPGAAATGRRPAAARPAARPPRAAAAGDYLADGPIFSRHLSSPQSNEQSLSREEDPSSLFHMKYDEEYHFSDTSIYGLNYDYFQNQPGETGRDGKPLRMSLSSSEDRGNELKCFQYDKDDRLMDQAFVPTTQNYRKQNLSRSPNPAYLDEDFRELEIARRKTEEELLKRKLIEQRSSSGYVIRRSSNSSWSSEPQHLYRPEEAPAMPKKSILKKHVDDSSVQHPVTTSETPAVGMGALRSKLKKSDYDLTPLEFVLKYWKVVGCGRKKKRLLKYCTELWPQYQVPYLEQWDKIGSLDYEIVSSWHEWMLSTGKPEEAIYMDIFRTAAQGILCPLESRPKPNQGKPWGCSSAVHVDVVLPQFSSAKEGSAFPPESTPLYPGLQVSKSMIEAPPLETVQATGHPMASLYPLQITPHIPNAQSQPMVQLMKMDNDLTPLECVLKYWKIVGCGRKKERLLKYCTELWPQYQVPYLEQWDKSGSFDYEIVTSWHEWMLSVGKPEEAIYMDIFRTAAQGILCPLVGRPKPNQGKPGQGSAAIYVDASLPQPSLAKERSAFPPLYPGLQVSKNMTEAPPLEAVQTIGHPMAAPMYPLQITSRIPNNAHGQPMVHHFGTHQPWDPLEFAKFKEMSGGFSKNPQEVINFLQSIFQTSQPNWQDVKVMASMIFTEVELNWILYKARTEIFVEYRNANNQLPAEFDIIFPWNVNPNWDINNTGAQGTRAWGGATAINIFRAMFLDAVRRAVAQHSNWSKLEEIYQGEEEDPAEFLQRLRDACRNGAHGNPDEADNQTVLKHLFTTHCAPDIRQKLQKLPGQRGLPVSALLDAAQQVYHSRMIEKEKRYSIQEMWNHSPSRGQVPKRRRRRPGRRERLRSTWKLDKNQCSCCKEMGHWHTQCPKRKPSSYPTGF